MSDPDWLVRSLFPPKRRLPRTAPSQRPPLMSPRSAESRRPPQRPPLPRRSGLRSPFHP